MPRLSLASTLKVTVWLCEPVVSEIEESDTEKSVITGLWLSVLVIVTLSFLVEVLPASSLATATYVAVCDP